MAPWTDNWTAVELRRFEETYGAEYLDDVTPCHGCGIPTPYVLLDAKPPKGYKIDSGADFERLECRDCYGPGWGPT